MTGLIIRGETKEDAAAIEALIVAAFRVAPHTSHTEQFIVRELRKAGVLSVSLIGEINQTLVAQVAVSPVSISDGSPGWYGLGPISVLPEFQLQGIGSQLMNTALDALREMGAAGCVLVGDPRFYHRFGFRALAQLVFADVPPEYFQAIAFGGDVVPSGVVYYHEAFDARA